jgi:helix-turn-helix protein
MPTETKKDDSVSLTEYVYLNTLDIEEPVRASCKIQRDKLIINAKIDSVDREIIRFDSISDLTISPPPLAFQDQLFTTVNIKFKRSDSQTKLCLIEYDDEYEQIFKHDIFNQILSGTKAITHFTAKKGGNKTNTSPIKAIVRVGKDTIHFDSKQKHRHIELGDIVNIKENRRQIGGERRDVLTVDHTANEAVLTSHIHIVEENHQNLFRRYVRREYASLLTEVSDIDPSEAIVELIVGLYTTDDLKQTASALTGNNTAEFESLYQEAIDYGLVTHPSNGTQLTQKGRLLANKELESVNE